MKKHAKKIVVLLLAVAMIIPTVGMIFTSAVDRDAVELAFNNIFILEDWLSNSLSSTVIADGVPNKGGTLESDFENGSFTLTKTDMAAGEIYTAFSLGTNSASENSSYYMMSVEPSTTYIFEYNVEGNIWDFQPFVFMYTTEGIFAGLDTMVQYATPGYGTNSFKFTTPSNVNKIQIRFTIGDDSVTRPDMTSVYATVKDIAIYKADLVEAYNLFDFSEWASNELSSSPIDPATGTITTDSASEAITFTTVATAGTTLWSGNAVLNPSTASTSYYSVDVEPNTSYTLTYSIKDSTLPGPVHCQPYIVEYDENGNQTALFNYETPALVGNKKEFTTTTDTKSLQIVFAVINDSAATARTCKVHDIGVYKTEVLASSFSELTGHVHRKAFTYGNGTYGSLPVPSKVPEGYVFADWFTGKDGSGIRITSDTEVLPSSYTVYPKYEPAVDSLTVAQMPAKTTYTVGEKFNPAGLVLNAAVGDSTLTVSSGYYCTPDYLNTVGTQTITVRYGGKTTTFTVNVTDGDEKSITVNGAAHPVKVANNNYTIEYSTTPFNRYELTYYSDSYVKGVITMDADTEVFFLEPSDNGYFASYIDSFLRGITHYSVISIEFTCLDKEFGNFELYSVSTINTTVPTDPTQFYQNDEYKVGISLDYGGVVSEIYDLKNQTASDPVVVRVYNENGKDITRVDHRSILDRDFGTNYKAESTEVNLINTNDRGRYLQQSYYGTDQPPFELGDYNGVEWPYNPVQGGNINHFDPVTGDVIKGGEASKVIDYRITDKEIYIKTRPLDWGKNSEDYPDSYVTDSYMEAWYVFEDGMIKTYCRFVDYSGYPSNTRDQELPALYTIEPLNNFVYHSGGEAWSDANVRQDKEEPDFWGVLPEYNALLQANGMPTVDVDVDCNENWAAFTASPDPESFGIGVYSAGVTDFHYGVFPAIYNEDQVKQGNLVENYRHTASLDPAVESPTSYISPVGVMTFESYKPIEYSYYVTTGTEEEIREDFRFAVAKDEAAAVAETKIAVPETVYMTPVNGASTLGQYYVNNILDVANYYDVKTVAQSDDKMYFGVHIDKATSVTVDITNATNPSDDINLVDNNGTSCDGATLLLNYSAGTGIFDEQYNLKFANTGLNPGEKATAKWEITATLEDGTKATYTAYTVLYAPGRTVGAVAEARQVAASQHEISSWITGATGVDHSVWSPLGSLKGDYKGAGYFTNDPLYNENAPSGGSGGTATDYIEEQITGADVDNNVYNENNYVMQTATNDHDSSRARSYLGLLTIDKSRYSNTNQIPNLKIGYDVLRIGSYVKNSLGKYTTYYTLGTDASYTATSLSAAPSGWTVYSGTYTDFADSHTLPYRESFVPAFDVSSDIDGMYIHALNQGVADQNINANQYTTAGTSVLIDITDKSELRDLVIEGYTRTETTPELDEAIKDAATVLGDPSSTQDEIDEAKKELADALYEYHSLKYDNIFSAYEFSLYPNSMTVVANRGTVSYNNGTLTVKNDTITDGEAYTNYGSGNGYYLVDLKPNTEYVFEYDVTTTVESQVFMFFYNDSGSNSEPPTNMSIKTDDGAWSAKSESNAWWGNYQRSAGTKHYTLKFTTGATTTKASFRFGNTTNDPCESTFSNIKLIDSARYYEDVDYAKTEDIYLNGQSYGALQTLTRTGFTFGGWVDANNKAVTGSDTATEHKSIYSVWNEHSYTIVYNANGGSGSVASQKVTYTQAVNLDSGNGLSKQGHSFIGWSTTANATSAEYQPGQAVSKLTANNNGSVTLYAVWVKTSLNVTFDNLIDMTAWQNSAAFKGNANIKNATDTGFSVTNEANGNEKTVQSPLFSVTAGKQYMIDIDITGNNWDVYIFFYDSGTTSGEGLEFSDSGNRFSANGSGNSSQIFTAPAGTANAAIRVDANQTSTENTVNFENIRVYEYDGISPVEVEISNKVINGGSTLGYLPTPTKEGFTFLGWIDESGAQVTADSAANDVNSDSVVSLKSTWKLADTALSNDKAVIDFGTPAAIDANANDTIFNKAATAYGATASITGFSTDGVNSTETANGTYGTFSLENGKVVYTPTTAVNGPENIYCHSKLSTGDTTELKSVLTVVPASNVLYEETQFAVTNQSGNKWVTVTDDTATKETDQKGKAEIYGYDEDYNEFVNYSNGSALKAEVTSENKRSQIISFTFSGTGFDLYSACGADTGVQVVTLKNNTTNKMVKSYIVDTYYSDARYGTLYQVPVINESGLEYGSYSIQIVASWLPSMSGALNADAVESQAVAGFDGMTANTAAVEYNASLRKALAEIGMEYVLDAETVDVVWFDDNSVLNGGMGVNTPAEDTVETAALTSLVNVVDSVRVYKPFADGDLYYISTETNADYYNVIGNLVSTDENGILSGSGIFAYVSGKDEEEITVDNYNSIGPKDELYLSRATEQSKAVTFTINGFNKDAVKVMISLRAAHGTPKAKIGSSQFDVISNTEMYYDITDYVNTDGTVTIQNVALSDSLLSVGTIKITSESVATASLSTEFNLMTARAMMMAPAEDVEPNVPVPEEPVVPEEPAGDDTTECYLVRFFNWIIGMFVKAFNFVKGIFGF